MDDEEVSKDEMSRKELKDDKVAKVSKDHKNTPWPPIIVIIFGIILIIYSLLGIETKENIRIFGAILIVLWTALTAIISWNLWIYNDKIGSWWFTVIALAVFLIFFIFVLFMDMEN